MLKSTQPPGGAAHSLPKIPNAQGALAALQKSAGSRPARFIRGAEVAARLKPPPKSGAPRFFGRAEAGIVRACGRAREDAGQKLRGRLCAREGAAGRFALRARP